MAKRVAVRWVVVLFLSLAIGLVAPGAGYGLGPPEQGEPDPAVDVPNPPDRVSGSPHLRLPKDMLDWPVVLPSGRPNADAIVQT